jgi:hypothetical protein
MFLVTAMTGVNQPKLQYLENKGYSGKYVNLKDKSNGFERMGLTYLVFTRASFLAGAGVLLYDTLYIP